MLQGVSVGEAESVHQPQPAQGYQGLQEDLEHRQGRHVKMFDNEYNVQYSENGKDPSKTPISKDFFG